MKKLGLSLNIFITLSILFGSAVMAVSGNFDIWKQGYEYIDASVEGEALRIRPDLKETHSTSELTLKIKSIKKVGSDTEEVYYTTTALPDEVELPLTMELFESTEDGRRIGSQSEGDLIINVGNKDLMSGSILNDEFEALATEL